jgi:hypothetical protein
MVCWFVIEGVINIETVYINAVPSHDFVLLGYKKTQTSEDAWDPVA